MENTFIPSLFDEVVLHPAIQHSPASRLCDNAVNLLIIKSIFHKVVNLLKIKMILISRKTILISRKSILISRKSILISRKTILISRKINLISRKTILISRKMILISRKMILISRKIILILRKITFRIQNIALPAHKLAKVTFYPRLFLQIFTSINSSVLLLTNIKTLSYGRIKSDY